MVIKWLCACCVNIVVYLAHLSAGQNHKLCNLNSVVKGSGIKTVVERYSGIATCVHAQVIVLLYLCVFV